MTLDELQAHIDALILSGDIDTDPQSIVLWDEVREQEPEAWSEMAARLIGRCWLRRGHPYLQLTTSLLTALVQQCDPAWTSARHPLSPAMCGRVRAVLDEMMERWR